MHRGAAPPQGRKELIGWLNALCNSEYPTVESLRDAAAYCTIIEAAANRIAKNYAGLDLPDAAAAHQKAAHAASALARLDRSATSVVCEGVDPSLDSVAVRKVCRENTLVLQDMLRSCVPKEHTVQIDVGRLSTGKLQDHMRFLQWLYHFMNKALLQYSRGALEKALLRQGEVAGVKLNRAQLLLEQKRKAGRGGGGGPSAQRTASVAATSSAIGGRPGSTAEAPPTRDQTRPAAPTRAAAPRHVDPAGNEGTGLTPVVEPSPQRPSPSSRSTSQGEVGPRAVAHVGPSEGGFSYPRAPVVVLDRVKAALVRARHSVEELEAMVMSAHESHLLELTRTSPDVVGDDSSHPALSALEQQLTRARHEEVVTPSLQELGLLLEERDAIAQVFCAVDSVVREFHARNAPSQLLTDLCAILYP